MVKEADGALRSALKSARDWLPLLSLVVLIIVSGARADAKITRNSDDIAAIAARLEKSEVIPERLASIEATLKGIDARTRRVEDRLDVALDRADHRR